jgi:hypothetical protein
VGGVAFIQHGRGTGCTSGQGKVPGRGAASGNRSITGNDGLSMSGLSSAKGVKTNSKGKFHCYNCGEPDHWGHDCPQLTAEQQQQLHMNLENAEGIEEQQEEAHQLIHVTLAHGAALPDNRAHMDGCSTITAFKSKKYLKGIKKQDAGIKNNCNTNMVITNLMGKYGSINA